MTDEQFVVHPEALRGYAGLLERNHGYTGQLREYLDGPGSQAEGLMGLMFQFQNLVEGMVAAERDTLATMLTKLGATVQGLRETADEYADVDAATAAEMDKIAPRGPEGGTRPGQRPE
ncbi:MAG TPA: hypothetical protein VGP26_10010 [Actinophytocola sp.]|nr:hypothetical protein [Actinophytocola sp.]